MKERIALMKAISRGSQYFGISKSSTADKRSIIYKDLSHNTVQFLISILERAKSKGGFNAPMK